MTYGKYPDLQSVKKVLVIKLRHLGDVLLTGPLFSVLKRGLPEAEIDAYVYKEAIPMLEGHPAISNIIPYDRSLKKGSLLKKFKGEFDMLRELKRQNYDCVLNLTEGDRGAIAAKYSRAKICVGLDPQGQGFAGKRKLYNCIVKHCGPPRHTVERNLDAVRAMGIFPSEEEKDLHFHIPDEAISSVQSMVGEEDFVLIHPASRWKFKCTSPEIMGDLITKLLDRGERVVLSAASDEVEWVENLLGDMKADRLINLAGKTNLKELGALIQLSKALICVDSVSNHIASALKAPAIVLFGPTSDLLWGPWRNPNGRVVAKRISCRPCFMDGCGGSKMSDCLFTLSADQILEAFDSVVS